jgi:hypothetical protein
LPAAGNGRATPSRPLAATGDATDAEVVVAVPSGQIADALGKVGGLAGKVAIGTTNPYAGRNEVYPSLAHEVKALVAPPSAAISACPGCHAE